MKIPYEINLTYPVRSLYFLMSVYIDGIPNLTCSSMDEEEFEFMCIEACEMIKHQVENAEDEEQQYFNNLVKNYKSYKDIIKYHVCKNHPEFYKFLKLIYAV